MLFLSDCECCSAGDYFSEADKNKTHPPKISPQLGVGKSSRNSANTGFCNSDWSITALTSIGSSDAALVQQTEWPVGNPSVSADGQSLLCPAAVLQISVLALRRLYGQSSVCNSQALAAE
ncbi:hypothetical protein SRHO_G00303460 [Serrasalmus rhombeus]